MVSKYSDARSDNKGIPYCVLKSVISRTKGVPEPLGLNFQSGEEEVFPPLKRGGRGGSFTRGVDGKRKRCGVHIPLAKSFKEATSDNRTIPATHLPSKAPHSMAKVYEFQSAKGVSLAFPRLNTSLLQLFPSKTLRPHKCVLEDVNSTMTYTPVLNRGGLGVISPADANL